MLKNLFALGCIAVIIFSCSKKSPTAGIVLSTAKLYDAVNGDAVGIIPAGTSIEYIDDMPMPPYLEGNVKIRFDTTEGYFDTRFGCFGCTTGALKQDAHVQWQGSDYSLSQGTLIAFDSVKGDNARIHAFSSNFTAWIATNLVSTDASDIEIAGTLRRMDTQEDDPGRFSAFADVVKKYPSNPLLPAIKVNISEAQEQDLADMQNDYELIFNQNENKVYATRLTRESWIEKYLVDILKPAPPDEEAGPNEEYTSPRYRYYDKYMAALPSFVKMTAKSYGLTWDRENTAERPRAYLLYRLDRSPENIQSLWSTHKEMIIMLLESGMVRDVRPYVNNLVYVYDRIARIPNHRAVIQDVSKKVAEWDNENTGPDGYIMDLYTQIDQAPLYEQLIDPEKYDVSTDGLAVWYHSFWLRRFNEGNEKVVYEILKEIAKINPQPILASAYEEDSDSEDPGDGQYEGDGDADGDGVSDDYNFQDERGDAETGQEVYSDCVFQEYSVGDCGHMIFSCGDFGDADISGLVGGQLANWERLTVSDDNGERANPDYVGKSFTIYFEWTNGPACNDGQGGEGRIPKINSFLLNN